MGATNALEAFRRYGGKVPASSLALLVYMALVSRDKDDWPYCRLGQHALAEFALGRSDPDDTDLRAVQRAMKPLLDAGAVSVDRAGASRADGNTTARYRLNLHERADEARREWQDTPDGKRRMSDGRRDPQHTTKSGGDIRRFVTRHTTKSGETPDGNRRTKETGGDMRSDKTKEEVSSTSTSHPSRVNRPREKDLAEVIPIKKPKPRRTRPADDTIAAAMAVRSAARAAHRARLAEETP